MIIETEYFDAAYPSRPRFIKVYNSLFKSRPTVKNTYVTVDYLSYVKGRRGAIGQWRIKWKQNEA